MGDHWMIKREKIVGIVGLGIMGGAFARNLAAAGWRVIGYDSDARARRALAKVGVEIAASTKGIAEKAPIIITSLPHPDALAEPAEAIAKAGVKRRVIVEASTFTLKDKTKAEVRL